MVRRFLGEKLGKLVDMIESEREESATKLYQKAVAELIGNLPPEATEAHQELAFAMAGNANFYIQRAIIDRYQDHPFLTLRDGFLEKIYKFFK